MLRHDPNTQYMGFISDVRNMLLLQALGLAIMDFVSDKFKIKWPVQSIGMLILIYSIAIGIKASMNFNDYINFLSTQPDLDPVYNKNLSYWKWWVKMLLVYIVLFILLILVIIGSFLHTKLRRNHRR